MATKNPPLDPQLQRMVEEIDSIRRESADLLESLDQEQLNWRPAPERWSVAECFDHLSLTGEALVDPLRNAIGEARRRGRLGKGPFGFGILGRFFIQSLQPGGARKVKAPTIYAPAGGSAFDGAVVQRRFMKLQEQLRDLIRLASGVDLSRVKVPSPAIRLIRLNGAAWLESTLVHERRHIDQARRVTAEPAFPRGGRN